MVVIIQNPSPPSFLLWQLPCWLTHWGQKQDTLLLHSRSYWTLENSPWIFSKGNTESAEPHCLCSRSLIHSIGKKCMLKTCESVTLQPCFPSTLLLRSYYLSKSTMSRSLLSQIGCFKTFFPRLAAGGKFWIQGHMSIGFLNISMKKWGERRKTSKE